MRRAVLPAVLVTLYLLGNQFCLLTNRHSQESAAFGQTLPPRRRPPPTGGFLLPPTVQLSWLISGPRDERIIGAFAFQDQLIVVGNTDSTALGGSRGARTKGGVDVFVRFLSTRGGPGSTIYVGGSGDDRATAAHFFYGQLYIVGETNSRDLATFVDPDLTPFRLQQPFQAAYRGGDSDGFVARIDVVFVPGRKVRFVSYLGGSGADRLTGVVYTSAAIVACGETTSLDFPTKQPIQEDLRGGSDAIIAALRPDGTSTLFSTYWGGSGDDRAAAIASGPLSNQVVVLGETRSPDFPAKNPLQAKSAGSRDLFISELDLITPEAIFSTYLGGTEDDQAAGVVVALDGSIVVAGSTASKDFPVVNPIHGAFRGGASDAVLLSLSPNGDALRLSTYWGGSGDDEACCLAMHRFGDIFLAGTTSSPDLALPEPVQKRLAGGTDIFLAHFGGGLSPRMSTYVGGPQDDRALGIFYGDSVYLAGSSRGGRFPVTQDTPDLPAGGVEGFVVKILPEAIFLPNLGLSRILQRELDFEVGTLPVEANELTITSSDPSRVAFSLDPKGVGTTSVRIPAKRPRPTVFVQGLENSGTVPYTVRASDTVSRQANVTLVPASFHINAQFGILGVSGGFRATTIDAIPLAVRPFVPAPLGATILVGSESIRPGVEPIALELRLSDPAVGVVTPSTIVIDSERPVGFAMFQPRRAGITNISVVPPLEFPTFSGSQLEATVVLPKLQIPSLQLGKDLQQEVRLTNPDRSYRTYEATVTSGNPNCLLLSLNPKDAGGPVLKLQRQGSLFPTFYAQSLCDSGTTILAAEIDAWERAEAPVTFLPSGIVFLRGGSDVVPSTVDPYRTVVHLASILPSDGAYRSLGGLRPGAAPASADVRIDRMDIARLAKGKVEFLPGGEHYDFVDIKPVRAGEFVVSVVPPAGFIEAADSKQELRVEDPVLSILAALRVGKDLQASSGVTVSHPAPNGGYQVKVVSSDPSKLLISSDRNQPGGQQVTVSIGEGSLGGTTAGFYLQALESSGRVAITATVAGLAAATATVTLEPSGFVLQSQTLSLFVNGLAEYIQVWSAAIDPLSGHPDTGQELRPGFGPIRVEILSLNSSVGVLENIPAMMPESYNSPRPQFKPLQAGETTLSVIQPPGFANPASETTKRIVVRQR